MELYSGGKIAQKHTLSAGFWSISISHTGAEGAYFKHFNHFISIYIIWPKIYYHLTRCLQQVR